VEDSRRFRGLERVQVLWVVWDLSERKFYSLISWLSLCEVVCWVGAKMGNIVSRCCHIGNGVLRIYNMWSQYFRGYGTRTVYLVYYRLNSVGGKESSLCMMGMISCVVWYDKIRLFLLLLILFWG